MKSVWSFCDHDELRVLFSDMRSWFGRDFAGTNLTGILHEFGTSFERVLHAFCTSLARVLHAGMHVL